MVCGSRWHVSPQAEREKPMTPSTILENAGYGHEPMRDIWINPKTKKVFSRTYLEDNDEGQVMTDMMDPTVNVKIVVAKNCSHAA
jgi:hypothetical protein